MRVTIVFADGLVAVDGLGYGGLDLSALAVGRREVAVEAVVIESAPEPVLDGVAMEAAAAELVAATELEPAAAPVVERTYIETRLLALQWDGAAGWVEEQAAATGEVLPNRAIDSLDPFQPALDAWDAAHKAATTPRPLTMAEIRARGLLEVDQQHQAMLLRLTGNPTDVERATWPGKVELARRVLGGDALALDQEAFLAAAGLDTAGKRRAYAEGVMAKSARFWTLVGLADRVRSEARARILAVQTMSGWEACGRLNREAAAAAIAEATAGMDAGGA